jgi:hypothetical protein
MQLKVQPTPDASLHVVDARPTSDPALVIHPIPVTKFRSITTGDIVDLLDVHTTWAVTHVPSRHILVTGLLTHDLAQRAASMLLRTGLELGPEAPSCLEVAAFQAAASLMLDSYLQLIHERERRTWNPNSFQSNSTPSQTEHSEKPSTSN